jgi:hypothetical protein
MTGGSAGKLSSVEHIKSVEQRSARRPSSRRGKCFDRHLEILDWFQIDGVRQTSSQHEEQKRKRKRIERSAARVNDGCAFQI